MEIVGSVDRTEIPQVARRSYRPPGIWAQLSMRAVKDHVAGRVTVVKLKDDKELKKMRAGLQIPLRKLGYKSRLVVIEQPDGLRAFLELALREEVVEAEAAAASARENSRNDTRPIAEVWAAR